MDIMVLILFGLMMDRSTAELQSPRTKGPSSFSSRRMTFPGRYLLIFLFINYIYRMLLKSSLALSGFHSYYYLL